MRIESVDRRGDLGRVGTDPRGPHAVEALGLIEQGGLAARAHLGDEGRGRLGGDRDIHPSARDELGELGSARSGATEVEGLDHRPHASCCAAECTGVRQS